MSTRPPNGADGGLVTVRLSEVNPDIRYEVASEILTRGRLSSAEAQEILAAAMLLNGDETLAVPVEKALLVLREGRLPDGPFLKVWKPVGDW